MKLQIKNVAAISSLHDIYKSTIAGNPVHASELISLTSEIRDKIPHLTDKTSVGLFNRYIELLTPYYPELSKASRIELSGIWGKKPQTDRKDLLSVNAQVSENTDRKNALRLMVSGIGRSGTTLIYQQLAKLLLLADLKTNFRYEPYLWNICSATAKGNSFGMSQLHQFGIMAHLETPLFLQDSLPLHDAFVDRLMDDAWDIDCNHAPDAYLTKVIRGSGRLRAYLKRYPDLKIVACLRNPIDTINSSLGMFSFFGDEFHADDRERFKAELQQRGVDTSELECGDRSVEWYGAWWRSFTEETLATAREFPDQVMLFTYEAFQEDADGTLQMLMDFVGINNAGMQMGLGAPAGPTIKATSLTKHDLHRLRHHIDYYHDTVLAPQLGLTAATERTNKTISKYAGGHFSFPIASSDIGKRAPIQLRGMLLNNGESPYLQLVKRPQSALKITDLVSLHGKNSGSGSVKCSADVEAIKCQKTFGAVVTCHNNSSTIVEAVLSCLNQTVPYDQIIVVDDKSTDNSCALIEELEQMYSSVRLLKLTSNVGPSAARDIGIRNLTTDFFTQLDGDDMFWPTKNEGEAQAIAGCEDVVAFSDILLARLQDSLVQSTSKYHKQRGSDVLELLRARTPQIPRDMTMSRDLYFAAGGYNLTMRLYEDWEFKMRLASHSRLWQRGDSTAGTIYNRTQPGLSSVHDGSHARALGQIFLSSLSLGTPDNGDLIASFDSMIGRFSERHVSRKCRNVLASLSERSPSELLGLSTFAASRKAATLDNQKFSAALDALANSGVSAGAESR